MQKKVWANLKGKVSVIGLGYVGLPLALAAAESGYQVVGIDLNAEKVVNINNGISPVEDVSNELLRKVLSTGWFKANTDFQEIKESTIVLICVPTPLLVNQKPDLTFLESALKSIKTNLTNSALVILESTVAPGTTRNMLNFMLNPVNDNSSIKIEIAFSPERIDPSNKNWDIRNTPKLVAGLTKESGRNAVRFYSNFVEKIIECESLEVAEAAKLLENSFRLINISFVNELSKFCQELGIDTNQVIKAAASKPYGFMAFYPSIGVGGHCIPVDPIYLSNKAEEIGSPITMINLAAEINHSMPKYFADRAEEKLSTLEGKRILVIGVAYKANVSDIRETPVEHLILNLRQRRAQVFWHDDLVKTWIGENSVELSTEYDLAILATPHDYLDLTKLGDVPILNTQGSI
jgi:UDP-N-acetyl-D-glucosamine dehydrogenase